MLCLMSEMQGRARKWATALGNTLVKDILATRLCSPVTNNIQVAEEAGSMRFQPIAARAPRFLSPQIALSRGVVHWREGFSETVSHSLQIVLAVSLLALCCGACFSAEGSMEMLCKAINCRARRSC